MGSFFTILGEESISFVYKMMLEGFFVLLIITAIYVVEKLFNYIVKKYFEYDISKKIEEGSVFSAVLVSVFYINIVQIFVEIM